MLEVELLHRADEEGRRRPEAPVRPLPGAGRGSGGPCAVDLWSELLAGGEQLVNCGGETRVCDPQIGARTG